MANVRVVVIVSLIVVFAFRMFSSPVEVSSVDDSNNFGGVDDHVVLPLAQGPNFKHRNVQGLPETEKTILSPKYHCPSLIREYSPIRQAIREEWHPINPKTRCVSAMSSLESLVPFVPLSGHPCPTGRPPFGKDYGLHFQSLNWTEIHERQSQSTFLLNHCPVAMDSRKFYYIDAGARDYPSSTTFFRQNYPHANKFHAVAYEVDEQYAAGYARDPDCYFEAAAVWNDTGYVTFYIDPNSMMGTGGGKFTKEKPLERPNHKTFRSVSLFDILTRQGVTESDFVVMKIDVEGAEWMLLRHLAQHDAFRLVDELFIECHNVDWNPRWEGVDGTTLADCHDMFDELRRIGVHVHEWY
jgi:FkbM family methyltransferase